jgi:hypothetical protein
VFARERQSERERASRERARESERERETERERVSKRAKESSSTRDGEKMFMRVWFVSACVERESVEAASRGANLGCPILLTTWPRCRDEASNTRIELPEVSATNTS